MQVTITSQIAALSSNPSVYSQVLTRDLSRGGDFGIDHLIVESAEFDGTVFWWCDMMGFTLERESGAKANQRIAFVKKGHYVVEVRETSEAVPASFSPKQLHLISKGYTQLCFSTDDVHTLVEALEARGATVVQQPNQTADDLSRIGLVLDTNGTIVELIEIGHSA